MKSLLWLSILAFFTPKALAENHHSPLLCPVDSLILQVQNASTEPQDFWFQDFGASPFQETHETIKAQGQLSLPLQEHLPLSATAIALKTHSSDLNFKLFCKSTQKEWSLENHPSPWKKLSLPSPTSALQLVLANLSQQPNPVEIFAEGPAPFEWKKIQTLILPEEFSQIPLVLPLPPTTRSVRIRAQGRWTGKVVAPAQTDTEYILEDEKVRLMEPPPRKARYFLFESQNPDSKESFVVALTDPRLIEESLEQIQNLRHKRLLVARIEKSLQGINRNFSTDARLPWSWQVLEAQNYADFAHISCDGSPGLVEERLNAWIKDTGATICFWNYRIVREIRPEEFNPSPEWWLPGRPFPPRKH